MRRYHSLNENLIPKEADMPDKQFLETVRSPGLAHLSYMIGHRGQAAVIDPRRDIQVYLDLAKKHDTRITHIFETHRNEDYVIGSQELRRATGAEIYHGEGLDWGYGQTVTEGETVELGALQLKVLQTPGHTDNSISIAVSDTSFAGEPIGVFTGDALFIGDVGRTDFYPDRPEEVAGLLYDSVFNKLLPLGDGVLLFPAHGAGSVCGSGMASRDFSTLGYERRFNPALQVDSRDDFIRNKVNEHHYKPPYFTQMEQYNQYGNAPEMRMPPSPPALSADEVDQAIGDGAIIIDIREPEAFAGGFVPGSLNIPADMIAAYAGWIVPYDRDILLVADEPSDVEHAVRPFIRLGYDRLRGYLRGGVHGWEVTGRKIDTVGVISADELNEQLKSGNPPTLLDVRKDEEWTAGHLEPAKHVYLGYLPEKADEITADGKKVVTFCGSGRRASIAASILRRSGVDNVANNLGSMAACQAIGCEITTED
jgi:hydroxyacylglutathione hydrolase